MLGAHQLHILLHLNLQSQSMTLDGVRCIHWDSAQYAMLARRDRQAHWCTNKCICKVLPLQRCECVGTFGVLQMLTICMMSCALGCCPALSVWLPVTQSMLRGADWRTTHFWARRCGAWLLQYQHYSNTGRYGQQGYQ